MPQKSELLKELGWNDALIKHFMVEDSIFIEHPNSELKAETFDTSSLTISYNALSSGTSAVVTINKKK